MSLTTEDLPIPEEPNYWGLPIPKEPNFWGLTYSKGAWLLRTYLSLRSPIFEESPFLEEPNFWGITYSWRGWLLRTYLFLRSLKIEDLHIPKEPDNWGLTYSQGAWLLRTHLFQRSQTFEDSPIHKEPDNWYFLTSRVFDPHHLWEAVLIRNPWRGKIDYWGLTYSQGAWLLSTYLFLRSPRRGRQGGGPHHTSHSPYA